EVYSRTWKMLDLTSYLIFRLTGKLVVDRTVAEEEGFIDYRTREISYKILEETETEADLLPEVRETAEIVADFAFGENRIELNAGTVDAIAAAISLGLVKEDMFGVTLGTTGIIYYSTRYPKPARNLYLDLSPVPGLYYPNGSTSSAGSFVDFVLEIMGFANDYTSLNRFIEESEPCSSGVIALPYIAGERTPILDPRAKSVFFGISTSTRRGDILRSAVEAVAYSIRHNLDAFRSLGYFPKRVLLTGGMTKSEKTVQILADVLRTEVELRSDASETDGDVIIARATKDGWHSSLRPGSGNTVRPDPARSEKYEECYRKYIEIYRRLRDLF
ncbi:MAG: xylulokinase, partial [Nitrososphaeria archaeon]